jgi:hypothetical protein
VDIAAEQSVVELEYASNLEALQYHGLDRARPADCVLVAAAVPRFLP